MSEVSPEGNFITRLLGRKKDQHPTKEQLIAEAEKNAREAVELFVHAPTQAPLVQYHPGKDNTFDLDKQNKLPGTILRVAVDRKIDYTGDKNESGFYWFVVGPTNSGDKVLFDIWTDPDIGSRHEFSDPELRVQRKFKLSNANIHPIASKVVDFFDNTSPFVGQSETVVKRIDVMAGGLAEKKKEPEKITSKVKVFAPGTVPQQGTA